MKNRYKKTTNVYYQFWIWRFHTSHLHILFPLLKSQFSLLFLPPSFFPFPSPELFQSYQSTSKLCSPKDPGIFHHVWKETKWIGSPESSRNVLRRTYLKKRENRDLQGQPMTIGQQQRRVSLKLSDKARNEKAGDAAVLELSFYNHQGHGQCCWLQP